jgi:ADP-ribosyl-[dinitrogen reductase] hydrolase
LNVPDTTTQRPNSNTLVRDRYRGALLGLAVGDALGTTLEFRAPGTFKPIDGIIGGGPFGLQPGQWTDDTSMALMPGRKLDREGKG